MEKLYLWVKSLLQYPDTNKQPGYKLTCDLFLLIKLLSSIVCRKNDKQLPNTYDLLSRIRL